MYRIMDRNVCKKLVYLYSKSPWLWDPRDQNYSNRSYREETWQRISQKMNLPVTILKKKLESLSGSYRREKSREKKSRIAGSGCDEVYKSSWYGYDWFSFLEDRYDSGTTRDTAVSNELLDNLEDQEYGQNFIEEIQIKQEKPSGSIGGTSNTKYPQKRKSEVFSYELMPEMETTAREESDDDECDLYCKLLAKKMKKLDERQRDITMHEIDNIMYRAKMMKSQPSNYKASNTKPESSVFIVQEQSDQYETEYLEDPMQLQET